MGVRVCHTPREGEGTGWGQSYTFDGFGNLKQVAAIKGSVPTLSVSYNAATNRRTSDCADANGNINGATAPTCLIPDSTYDVANRLTTMSSADATYAYTPGNQRLYKKVGSDEELTFWGANGQKLVSYELVVAGSDLHAENARTFKYFGGRLIYDSNQVLTNGFVYTDRLGSTVKTYPFGQERPSATSNDEQKFATYYRDAESGLDYAMNRYHSAGDGRFLSPDPYMASGGPADPGSWSRYAYVGGDPINRIDPQGLEWCSPYDQIFSGCTPIPPECELDPSSMTCRSTLIGIDLGGGVSPSGPTEGEATYLLNGLVQSGIIQSWKTDRFLTFSAVAIEDGVAGVCFFNPELCSAAIYGAGWLISVAIEHLGDFVAILREETRTAFAQGRSLRKAEDAYRRECGKPFPRSKRSERYDRITTDKRQMDGFLGADEILEIMLELAPCDPPPSPQLPPPVDPSHRRGRRGR